MKTCVHREPDSAHMVTEPVDRRTLALLCVACGWEAVATVPRAPWLVYREHPCRLTIETVSETL